MHQLCLSHIHTTPLHLSQMASPSSSLSLTLYPSLTHSCFGLSFRLSLNLGVSLKFKFKFKQLHWHDKRESGLGSFSVPAPSQSSAPWPSNLWSGLEYGLCDVEEGVRSVDSHTMGMSAWCWCGGQL